MVGSIHDEVYTFCYLAEFADYKFILVKVVMMRYMTLEICVTEISKIADNSIGVLYRWLYVGYIIDPFYRVYLIGVG